VNHCTSFVRGLRPHLWRGGNISFGHLECQGGSERSGSVCRRSHVIWCKHTPILSPLSSLPCLRPSESLHLVCARPSPTSMARREHQLWASGVPGWVGTVRFCVQEESCNMMVQTHTPFSRPFRHCPVSAQVNHCTSFVRGLRPHLWRGGNISFGHLECQGGSERSGSVCRRSHVIWCKHTPPFSRPFRHCPVSAQVNHCTSFVRGLRPHLWRGGNISFGHLECQGGSERSGSVCRRSHVIWWCTTPILSPLSTLPCPRTSESLHLVCARPSPTSMAMREHQLWASGGPGWVGTVRFCVQEESCIWCKHPPPFSRPFRHCPVPAQVNHCTSFVRGLRPHLWRCGNISFGHLEGQGGSERSGSVCRRSHVI
jgi:hypothetical protein